jgi:hypothetical protein
VSSGPRRPDRSATAPVANAPLVAELDRWIHAVPEYDALLGADGAGWLVEGVENGRHFAVHTWSPTAGWVREMGLRFPGLAGLSEKRVY